MTESLKERIDALCPCRGDDEFDYCTEDIACYCRRKIDAIECRWPGHAIAAEVGEMEKNLLYTAKWRDKYRERAMRYEGVHD